MRELLDLYLTFARIGGFTFGGGYAMLPILQKDVVEKKKWATEEELMDYYAIGQCTPGIIAINVATFIGFRKRGVAGAAAATFGMVSPSLVIIMIIAAVIQNFADIPWVQHALAGITVCVCVLVFDTVIKLAKKSLKDAWAWIIFLIVLALSLFTDITAVFLVLGAGILGVAVKSVLKGRKEGEEK